MVTGTKPYGIRRVIVLMGCALTVALLVGVFYPRGPGRGFYQLFAIRESIRYQYEVNGLWPPSTEQFFSSIVGEAAGPLRANGSSSGPYNGLRLLATQKGDHIVVSIRLFRPSGAKTNHAEYYESLPHSPEDQTARLLRTASSGTAWWRKSVARWFWFFDRAFPESVSVSPPATGFDIPGSCEQLDRYWAWLGEIAGSGNRFRDGWGNRIRLSLDEKSDPPRLVASSAGPDGKWDTEDDMILKRDTKTGSIVQSIGFDQQDGA